MKIEQANPIVIHGTGFYKKGSRTLYRRVFRGELDVMYFKQLFYLMKAPKYKNVQELGDLQKIEFRIRNWIYKRIVIDDNNVKLFK